MSKLTLESEDTTLRLRLVSNVRVLLSHTDHHTLVTRATDDGREDLFDAGSST